MTTEFVELLLITFKFGGYWANVRKKDRKKYKSGKQKTLKYDKSSITLALLQAEVEKLCPWVRGTSFELHYHVSGSSPKKYTQIVSNIDVNEMLQSDAGTCSLVEVVVSQLNEVSATTVQENVSDMRNTKLRLVDEPVRDDFSDSFSNEDTTNNQLRVGTRFSDASHFKQFIRTQAITQDYEVVISSSDSKRIIVVCAFERCPWRVRASVCTDGETFEIRKVFGSHSCPGVNRTGNKVASVDWVANEIEDIVKKHPDIPPKQINSSLERKYGLSLSYMKTWRSREQARESIFGSADTNYKWVPALAGELQRRNPGSHIVYEIDAVDNSFRRFFVAFRVCVAGFLEGCRPILGLDACHLKSKFLGMLLSAVTLDGNNTLFVVAFAVVETESKGTWCWFLENLQLSFGVHVEPLAFMSDMEKGLAEATKQYFPHAEHRVCLRHLWKNVKKQFRVQEGHTLRNLFWSAANTYTDENFICRMGELYASSPAVFSYLASMPYLWSKSQYSAQIKSTVSTNNMAESFNAWITEARNRPAVDLIDTIRAMIMDQRAKRNMKADTWQGQLTPYAEDYIRDITSHREQFIVRLGNSGMGEVEGNQERQVVNLVRHECSCKVWQVSGLPCIHAVAFISAKGQAFWPDYVSHFYYTSRYKIAYAGYIAPMPGKAQWEVVHDTIQVDVPKTTRPRGRPKKKRFKSFLEENGSSRKIRHKCSRCGSWGHHRTSCKNPIGHTGQRDGLSAATSQMRDPGIQDSFVSTG